MKIVLLMMALSFSVFASEGQKKNDVLVELEGINLIDQTKCTYTAAKMNEWEGQVVIWISSGDNGFRVELDSEKFAKGKYVSQYDDVKVKVRKNTLTASSSERHSWYEKQTQEVTINFGSDLLNPKSVQAEDLHFVGFQRTEFEELNCKF